MLQLRDILDLERVGETEQMAAYHSVEGHKGTTAAELFVNPLASER